MKVLITGGAGYIGSILVPELLSRNHEVVVADNFFYGQSSLLDCCNNKNLKIIRGDARDEAMIKQAIKGVDYIFPLACLTGAPLCKQKPLEAKAINLDAVKLVLSLRDKKQRVIFPTTNSGYGIGQEGVYCTEETPLNPVSLYGKLKVEAEQAVLDAGNSITLRLATVFGISPRMRLDLLVNDFTYRAVVDKSVILFEAHFKRNYVHVRDVARAFIHCMDNFDKMKGEPYNVGLSEANLSKMELCTKIKDKIPAFTIIESQIGQDPDKRNYVVSNDKIEATGYKTSNSLDDGIAELIKGYQVVRRNAYSNV